MAAAKVKIPKTLERALRRRNKHRSSRHTEPVEVEASPYNNHDAQTGDSEDGERLPWRPVPRSRLRSGFEDASVLAFEEIDGVDVVYEEQEGGRRVAKLAPKHASDGRDSKLSERGPKRRRVAESNGAFALPSFDIAKLPGWSSILLHPALKERLHHAGFLSPTDIQARALPHALEGKDVIAIAETGSGKTLAYGLPILGHTLLAAISNTSDDATPIHNKTLSARAIKALVLAPTRELALQVCDHLRRMVPPLVSETLGGSEGPGVKPPPLVSIAAIVGGMSLQKQKRILDRGLDILVATPGRLWDIIQEDDNIASQISNLRFLVLDEADRMIEAGHFQELENIVKLTLRPGAKDGNDGAFDPEFIQFEKNAELSAAPPNELMQTFVYSATLSKELQKNLKKRPKLSSGASRKNDQPKSTLDDLLLRLDFRDPEPTLIDLSPEGGAVATLHEAKIECAKNDKELYLYYFLLRYPGRSLVFVTSIDSIRRVLPLLENLQIQAYPLHSQLQQKQRLKNLDRFKAASTAVLVATDVAARGLDIPSVEHVIHYQLPRSADVYVHRNGRTARAKREGFSLLLIGPEERSVARALLISLGRTSGAPELSIEYDILAKLKERIVLARSIDAAQHTVKKKNHEDKWLRETAEALEIDIDSDHDGQGVSGRRKRKRILEDGDEGNRSALQEKNRQMKSKLMAQRSELKALLAQPLVARGISTRYLTSGSKSIADDIINSSNHQNMLGISTGTAQNDVVKARAKKISGRRDIAPSSLGVKRVDQ